MTENAVYLMFVNGQWSVVRVDRCGQRVVFRSLHREEARIFGRLHARFHRLPFEMHEAQPVA